MTRKTLTEIKNIIMSYLINDKELVRALVVNKSNFLTCEVTDNEKTLIDNPEELIRKQIFPYQKDLETISEAKTLITSFYDDFKKEGQSYRSGKIILFILIPSEYEQTNYGSRYDFISDRIEEIFKSHNIGDLEPVNRGDLKAESRYLGSYLEFKVIDFYLR